MKKVWWLYIYSFLKGIRFEISHFNTSLVDEFISKNECINTAKHMNSGSLTERQIVLDLGIKICYICKGKTRIGLNTWKNIFIIGIKLIIKIYLNARVAEW